MDPVTPRVVLGALAYGGLRLWWLRQPKPFLNMLLHGGEVERSLERRWAHEQELARGLEPQEAYLREHEAMLNLQEKALLLRERERALADRAMGLEFEGSVAEKRKTIHGYIVEEPERLRRLIAKTLERTH